MKARTHARRTLDNKQEEHEPEQHCGELCSGNWVAERKPRAEYAGSESLHAEIGDRAKVRQRFHQRQCRASHDAGARQRQGNLEKRAPRAIAAYACDFEHAVRLLEKGRAGEQIHVRVEHEREHDDRAAERAHVGEPVVARSPPRQLAQPSLHRPRKLEEVGISVRHDVRRYGQGQQQSPVEDLLAGEAAHHRQPRARHPAHHDAHGNTPH